MLRQTAMILLKKKTTHTHLKKIPVELKKNTKNSKKQKQAVTEHK
jgi:hypothetical protein